MPEQFCVSPLLDDYTLGVPLQSHSGVICYPAIKNGTDQRFIVKAITIPQSQTQLNALLITGAYSDPAQALDYFRSLTADIEAEACLLRKLSETEGFLPFDGWQTIPLEHGHLGYQVFLVSSYRLSLEKYMRRHSVTHLEAVNLGIDMCAALSACRETGMIYVSLKPSNIFISPKKEYKIGDLGFSPLKTLKYTSMPERCRSMYTAPELLDDFNVLNETADTYSLGMILYQIFNNGVLPENRTNPEPAANADPAISRIILKAIAADPSDRWATPTEMGQALVAYMQTNSINNTMIMSALAPTEKTGVIPFVSAMPEPEETAETAEGTDSDVREEISEPEEENDSDFSTVFESEAAALPDDADPFDDPMLPEIKEFDLTESDKAVPEQEEEQSDSDTVSEEESEVTVSEDIPESPAPSAETDEEPSDPVPGDETSEDSDDEKPAEGEDNSPGLPEVLLQNDLDSELKEVSELLKPAAPSMPKLQKIEPAPIKPKPPKKKGHGLLIGILVLVLLLAAAATGYLFYSFYYLQNIQAIHVDGTQNRLAVSVDTRVDNSLLTAVCSDSYGNTVREQIQNGSAVFTDLNPGSLYKITLEISGLHKLTGKTSEIFITESITNIVSLTAITGSEDGSVLLNFVTEGHEPDEWRVVYSAEGEPELGLTFSGHNAAVVNLAVGKEYTFSLETTDGSPLTGKQSIVFTAQNVILAHELNVSAVEKQTLTVTWMEPNGANVDSWHVHCFGEDYDESVDVTQTQVTFSGIKDNISYTIEVTAAGMTQPARTSLSANPITIKEFDIDESASDIVSVSWDYDGPEPEGGWLLMYSVDGNTTPNILKCPTPFAAVSPRIPGSQYHFTVQAADNASVFNGTYTFTVPDAKMFVGHAITAYAVKTLMLPTPSNADWNYFNTPSRVFTTEFSPSQSISLIVRITTGFYLDDENVEILYVIRDEYGNAMPELCLRQSRNWAHMWEKQDYHVCSLGDLRAPSAEGKYSLELYFDGGLAATVNFTVS